MKVLKKVKHKKSMNIFKKTSPIITSDHSSIGSKKKKKGKSIFPLFLTKPISKLDLNIPFVKFRNQSFQKWLIIILTSTIVGILLSPKISIPNKSYKLDDIAQRNIKANNDFLIEDKTSTEKRRQKTAEEQQPIYDFDQSAISKVKEKLSQAFDIMQKYQKKVLKKTAPKTLASKSREQFEKILGFPLTKNDMRILKINKFNPNLENYILTLLAPILSKGIVGNRDLLLTKEKKGIIIRNVQTKNETYRRIVSPILDLKMAKEIIVSRGHQDLSQLSKPLRKVLIKISQEIITPNLTFNKNETEERCKKAVEEVKPVFFHVKMGEMIIREGEKVNEEHLLKLAAIKGGKKEYKIYFINLGLIFLTSLILYIIYRSSASNIKNWSKNIPDLFLLAIILIAVIISTKASIFIASAISEGFPHIPFDSLLFAAPLTFGVMLISVLLNAQVALIFSIPVSILSALLFKDSMMFFIYFVIGNVIAAMEVAHCSQRNDLIKAGVFVGLINILTLFCLKMVQGSEFQLYNLFDIAFGFTGGMLAGIMVTGIVPLFEVLFKYTTDIKLLELANLNQPILKELVVQAPGTYHHSIIVGSLVEAASESINANPLLAKVSAYYHDIGKIKKPLYFIENQKDKENKHDKLTPSMSSLILISHVKDGVELAKRERLGKAIIDIIQQHHGTTLISYFYQKAKKQENPGVQSVDEKDYRYPGPKPQTKEAGLVMLADAVEASSKTLTDPTPSRIKGLVQSIINDIFTDGQLNECEITIKDLYQIAESYTLTLNGIFHRRIEYPQPTFEKNGGDKKKLDEHINKQSTKSVKNSSNKVEKNSQ